MTDDSTNEFLAHFGVKGMRWGVRHDPDGGGGSGPSRSQTRAANRLEKAKNRATQVAQRENARQERAKAQAKAEKNRDAVILKARQNVDKSARDVRIAKAQYKVNRHEMGKQEAKKILRDVKSQHNANRYNASLQTGKEQVIAQQEAYRQMQYRQMMRQEYEAQRRREQNAQLIRELLAPRPSNVTPIDRRVSSTTTTTRSKTESPKHSAVGPRHRA